MSKRRSLLDAYRFPGFRPRATIKGIFGDPKARVIRLERRQKKRRAAFAAQRTGVFTTGRCGVFGTFPAGTCESTWRWRSAGSCAGGAAR
ncbi:MAG: hypothetical protein V3R93_07535 [Candidatus Hydrothermarchaeaceae archaeon]